MGVCPAQPPQPSLSAMAGADAASRQADACLRARLRGLLRERGLCRADRKEGKLKWQGSGAAWSVHAERGGQHSSQKQLRCTSPAC